MGNKTPLQVAKDVMSGRTTVAKTADGVNRPMPPAKAKAKAKPKGATYKPDKRHVTARQMQIEAAREADERAIAKMEAEKKAKGMKKGGMVKPKEKPLTNKAAKMKKASEDADMDRNMQRGLENYEKSKKKKRTNFAKGGKVRGCGIAQRGLGRAGSRSR